jgi:hypothetical protein
VPTSSNPSNDTPDNPRQQADHTVHDAVMARAFLDLENALHSPSDAQLAEFDAAVMDAQVYAFGLIAGAQIAGVKPDDPLIKGIRIVMWWLDVFQEIRRKGKPSHWPLLRDSYRGGLKTLREADAYIRRVAKAGEPDAR